MTHLSPSELPTLVALSYVNDLFDSLFLARRYGVNRQILHSARVKSVEAKGAR